MLPEVAPSTEIIIALMGVTGAGKSYFIREVTGNSQVGVSDSLHSHTQEVQSYSFPYEGAKITLVDTPGFDDTKRSDTDVLKEITNWTSKTYREGQLLSGIIYLHPITHTRMEGSSLRNLRMFQKLCGQQVLENVLLTTTQWSNTDPTKAQHRENELQGQDFWGGLISRGATLQRFLDTRESGLELIRKLMPNIPKPLDIQDQIVEKGMTLLETEAGKWINEELLAQEKKHKEEIEALEKDRQEAIKAKDDEMNQILAEEQAKAQKKLEKAAAEKKLLEEQHAADIKKREAEEERRRREEAKKLEKAAAEKKLLEEQHAADIKKRGAEEAERKRLEVEKLEKAAAEKKLLEERLAADIVKREVEEAERKRLEPEKKKQREEAEKKRLEAERKKWEEAERKRQEEAERRENAVIAVATKDISVTAHISGLFGSFSTRGRWILDINNEEEFESNTFAVKIQYKLNILFGLQVVLKTFLELFDEGMGTTNYIDYRGVRYKCGSGYRVTRGNRDFIIFSRG